jgi:hypothetical protein
VTPEPDDFVELDGDCSRADLADALQHLPWNGHRFVTVRIDREVAIYFAALLQRR